MSATDWDLCPACAAKQKAWLAERRLEVEAMYGKVTADEYLAALDALKKDGSAAMEQTLREDYQMGIDDDGKFHCFYRAACQECSFSYEFKKTEQTLNPPGASP